MQSIEELVTQLGEADVQKVARAICESEGVDPDQHVIQETSYERREGFPGRNVTQIALPMWHARREEARKLIALYHGAAAYLAAARGEKQA